MKKILFIQHASGFGGSAMSLLYTLQGVKASMGNKVMLIVALAKWTKELDDFYSTAGFKVVKPNWIDTYEHTTALNYNLLNPLNCLKELKQQLLLKKAIRNTRNLISQIKPDIVHLNSVVLVGSAIACKQLRVATVWHVREHPVHGLFGLRKKIIVNLLSDNSHQVIFICNADKEAWGNISNGQVVYNFIDFNLFRKSENEEVSLTRDNFNREFRILFLGGVNKIKGLHILLKALKILIIENPEVKIKLLFPGGIYNVPKDLFYKVATKFLKIVGSTSYSESIEDYIRKQNLEINIERLTYTKNIFTLFDKSDVLVFPSIRPHFARPIIEAGAMCIPAIGSSIEGVKELIVEGENGFLCEPGNVDCLKSKLEYILKNPIKSQEIGKNGFEKALIKFSQDKNIDQIIQIYNQLST